MKKWLSRHVVVNNNDIGLSIVTQLADGTVNVRPFNNEESNTTYTDKTIVINNKVTPPTLHFISSGVDNDTNLRPDDIG